MSTLIGDDQTDRKRVSGAADRVKQALRLGGDNVVLSSELVALCDQHLEVRKCIAKSRCETS